MSSITVKTVLQGDHTHADILDSHCLQLEEYTAFTLEGGEMIHQPKFFEAKQHIILIVFLFTSFSL